MVNDHHLDALKFSHANFAFLCSIPAVHLGQYLDRANLVAPMANAERLIPYLEQLLRCPFHIGRDLLLDFFFRGLLQLVDNFPDTLAARTSPRIGGEWLADLPRG